MRRMSAIFSMFLFVGVVCPPLTLWVDKDSLLIVQAFERSRHDGFETETTTIYKPQVNVTVAAEKLALSAPEKWR